MGGAGGGKGIGRVGYWLSKGEGGGDNMARMDEERGEGNKLRCCDDRIDEQR